MRDLQAAILKIQSFLPMNTQLGKGFLAQDKGTSYCHRHEVKPLRCTYGFGSSSLGDFDWG